MLKFCFASIEWGQGFPTFSKLDLKDILSLDRCVRDTIQKRATLNRTSLADCWLRYQENLTSRRWHDMWCREGWGDQSKVIRLYFAQHPVWETSWLLEYTKPVLPAESSFRKEKQRLWEGNGIPSSYFDDASSSGLGDTTLLSQLFHFCFELCQNYDGHLWCLSVAPLRSVLWNVVKVYKLPEKYSHDAIRIAE